MAGTESRLLIFDPVTSERLSVDTGATPATLCSRSDARPEAGASSYNRTNHPKPNRASPALQLVVRNVERRIPNLRAKEKERTRLVGGNRIDFF